MRSKTIMSPTNPTTHPYERRASVTARVHGSSRALPKARNTPLGKNSTASSHPHWDKRRGADMFTGAKGTGDPSSRRDTPQMFPTAPANKPNADQHSQRNTSKVAKAPPSPAEKRHDRFRDFLEGSLVKGERNRNQTQGIFVPSPSADSIPHRECCNQRSWHPKNSCVLTPHTNR